MSERRVGGIETSARLDILTLAAIRRCVGTRPRRWLLAVTLLLGMLAAVAITAGSPADRTFAAVSGAVQSLMSITVPLIGVLLVGDLRRAGRPGRLTPTLLAAVLVAAGIGAFGALVCAVALRVAPAGPVADPWDQIATIAVGSLLVQVMAQLVGTGLSLLIRPAVVAFLASIVLPLGLWAVLGSVDILSAAQVWLTPFANVQHLFAGQMRGLAWVQWFVVFLLWGAVLNAVGAWRLKKRRPAPVYP